MTIGTLSVDLAAVRVRLRELIGLLFPESLEGVAELPFDFGFSEFRRLGLDVVITSSGTTPGTSDHVIRLGICGDVELAAAALRALERDPVAAHLLDLEVV